jgi:hypothetical protein
MPASPPVRGKVAGRVVAVGRGAAVVAVAVGVCVGVTVSVGVCVGDGRVSVGDGRGSVGVGRGSVGVGRGSVGVGRGSVGVGRGDSVGDTVSVGVGLGLSHGFVSSCFLPSAEGWHLQCSSSPPVAYDGLLSKAAVSTARTATAATRAAARRDERKGTPLPMHDDGSPRRYSDRWQIVLAASPPYKHRHALYRRSGPIVTNLDELICPRMSWGATCARCSGATGSRPR